MLTLLKSRHRSPLFPQNRVEQTASEKVAWRQNNHNQHVYNFTQNLAFILFKIKSSRL